MDIQLTGDRALQEYDFFKKLCTLPFIEAIYMHGSRSRVAGAPNSDYDLAILCPQATQEQWWHVEDIIRNSNILLKVDCVRIDKPHVIDGVITIVNHFKKLLYIRRRGNAYLSSLMPIRFATWQDFLTGLLNACEGWAANPNETQGKHLLQEFAKAYDHSLRMLRYCLKLHNRYAYAPVFVLHHCVSLQWVKQEALWRRMIADRVAIEENNVADRDMLLRLFLYYLELHWLSSFMRSVFDKNAVPLAA